MDGRLIPGGSDLLNFGWTSIPDARGRFLRAKDNGAGVSEEKNLGDQESHSTDLSGIQTTVESTEVIHNHGETLNDGTHNHSGSADANGQHNHDGITQNEDEIFQIFYNSGTNKFQSGSDVSWTRTELGGHHKHAFITNNNGNHGHSLSVNAEGDHTHTTTNDNTAHVHDLVINGDAETRPKSLIINVFVKIK